MRRRLAAALLLALALPALALAADTDPQKKLTAADQAKARTLVLRKADFAAGWTRKPPTKSDANVDYSCPNYNPKQSDLVLTGEAEAEFAGPQGIPGVHSTANIYRTRQQAETAWRRGDRPELVPCAARTFEKALEEDGTQVTVTRKGKIAFPRLSPRTSAYRFSFAMTVMREGKPLTVTMTMHFVILGHGRGDVALMTVGVGPGVSLADLKTFAKLSAQRLAAAKL